MDLKNIKFAINQFSSRDANAQSLTSEYPELHRVFFDFSKKVQRTLIQRHNEKVITTDELATVANCLNADFIEPYFIERSRKFELKNLASFATLIALRTKERVLSGSSACHEWKLDDKIEAYRYADLLDIRRPWYKISKNPLEEIRYAGKPICLKPLHGDSSIGVFLIRDLSDIFDVYESEFLTSFSQLECRIKHYSDNHNLNSKAWITEELLVSDKNIDNIPANYNFLCFYGKCALARVIERSPVTADGWWNREGERVTAGPVIDKKNISKISSIPENYFKLAEEISKTIPSPFIRIDFNETSTGLVFNEFTPRPGSYKDFNAHWDNRLGNEFLIASRRLFDDLYNGKDFTQFKNFESSLKK